MWLVVTGLASGDDPRGGMFEAVVVEVKRDKVSVRCEVDRNAGGGKGDVIKDLPLDGTPVKIKELAAEGDGCACVFARQYPATPTGYAHCSNLP